MNSDCEVLRYLYLTADERVKCLNALLKQDYSPAFVYVLANELSNSRRIRLNAKAALTRLNIPVTQLIGTLPPQKAAKTRGVEKDEKKVAETLIKNATAQVIGIGKKLKENKDCNAKIIRLAEKNIEIENMFMARLRGFL